MIYCVPGLVLFFAAALTRMSGASSNLPAAVESPAIAEPDLNPKRSTLGWGPWTNRLQCRLRAVQTKLEHGQWPRLLLDFKNHGDRELTWGQTPDYWELECDGIWYRADVLLSGDARIFRFLPPIRLDRLPLLFAPEWQWQAKAGGQPLVLGPGKHTLRVALQPVSKKDGPPPRVVSNLLQIEIAAKKPDY